MGDLGEPREVGKSSRESAPRVQRVIHRACQLQPETRASHCTSTPHPAARLMATHDLTQLQEKWSAFYKNELPRLAKARGDSQPEWPVVQDHCFARIILDNAVGEDRPWMERVRAPATKHMSRQQLEAALDLGRKIASGEADLNKLNQRSLELRGKSSSKRKHAEPDGDATQNLAKKQKKGPSTEDIRSHFFSDSPKMETPKTTSPPAEILQARNTKIGRAHV